MPIPRDEADTLPTSTGPPCAVCAKPSEYGVWGGTQLCVACAADYLNALDLAPVYPAAEMVERTARWVEKQKKARAT